MEPLLVSVSKVETSFLLVENLIHNIYIYELPEGNLIVNLRFNQSQDYDSNLIGGLTATIQEFANDASKDGLKSISLEELNLLFKAYKQFLMVFAVDADYPDEQFIEPIDAFVESFEGCLGTQEYGTTVDGAAIAIQTMHTLISEEIHMEIQLGSKVTVYPFKLRELANKTAEKLLGMVKKSAADLYDDSQTDYAPIQNDEDAVNQMLGEFLSTFADVKEITLIRTTMMGEFEQYTKTRLDKDVSDAVYEIVNGMIDIVSHLLEEDLDNRTIDVESQIILFQKVTDLSFLYVVFDMLGSDLEVMEPIVEKVAKSIANKFPDELSI